MLKSFRLAAVPVVLLALTAACSSTNPSQKVSLVSKSQASAQTRSSDASPEVALASHLRQIGAKLYGVHWCRYCNQQKEVFGKEAFAQLDYVECDPAGKDARPNLCQEANVKGFPTWEINGKLHTGLRSLQDLAKLSDYPGDRNFKN
jgi:hypothetical protein